MSDNDENILKSSDQIDFWYSQQVDVYIWLDRR